MTVTEQDIALVTVREAAQLAGVSAATVRKWVYRYGIPRRRGRGGKVLLPERAVLDVEAKTRRATRGRPRVA